MLQVARLAPSQLGDAAGRIATYLRGCWCDDGGARDRGGHSDLYYTVFTLEGLAALQVDPGNELLLEYLNGFGTGDQLDLVHLCCLARCWAGSGAAPSSAHRQALLDRLEAHRGADGGYAETPAEKASTLYHTFLACGARQDLGAGFLDRDGLLRCVTGLSCDDGSYSNDAALPIGNTPSTAAAVTLLRQLGGDRNPRTGDWLLSRLHAQGGFLALPDAPLPDLLSTATALHALAGLERSFEPIREACLDFIDTLWTGQAFCGNWSDDQPDAEYTWYALLALGHLSL